MTPPTVLVTGASTGIGRALCHAWASSGATLVMSARTGSALEAVAREVEARGGRALVEVGDVTDEAHRLALVSRALHETGRLDVLVNNAGRGFLAPAMKVDVDKLRDLFELNVLAPLRLAQIAAPALARTHGTVVMMSSIAGVVAPPRYAAYSASKFALEAIAMAMRSELASAGVRVVVVRPGPVATPFRVNATVAEGESYDAPVDKRAQPAEEVARLTLRAVERGSAVVETSRYVRLTAAAARVAPPAVRVALRKMAGRARS